MTRSIDITEESVRTALHASHGVVLLNGVLADAVVRAFIVLLQELTTSEPDAAALAQAYSRAFSVLAAAANMQDTMPALPDAWQAYLITRILDDVNPWSTQAEGASTIAPGLRHQALRDLRALRLLFDLGAQGVWKLTNEIVTASMPVLQDAWVPWYNLTPPQEEGRQPTARDILGHLMAESADWSLLVDQLTDYWSHHGTGMFARYHVLRWQGQQEGLRGIAHPDPVRLRELVGYEREQGLLRANTERFLAGLPAHDTVLYGAPGTGKSSTVKALANEYAERGLRLIEVRKDLVSDLPLLASLVRGRAPRFLLFIDDLSFEEHETEYKALKVLLEGAAETRPANLLIYATTNRLNLIREQFSDRGKPSDDVHWRDTMDEKSSLVARFGLRVTFSIPNQEHYLKITASLAEQRGLPLSQEELRTRALTWERQHVGRSGRLARQFVDDLEAELGGR